MARSGRSDRQGRIVDRARFRHRLGRTRASLYGTRRRPGGRTRERSARGRRAQSRQKADYTGRLRDRSAQTSGSRSRRRAVPTDSTQALAAAASGSGRQPRRPAAPGTAECPCAPGQGLFPGGTGRDVPTAGGHPGRFRGRGGGRRGTPGTGDYPFRTAAGGWSQGQPNHGTRQGSGACAVGHQRPRRRGHSGKVGGRTGNTESGAGDRAAALGDLFVTVSR